MSGVPGVPWLPHYRHCADALTVLTVAATVTDQVRLGTSVLVAPLRPALQLARMLATIDQVSGGRVVAGLGSGWSSDEYRAMGADFGGRGSALEESIDACRALWAADPVSFTGTRTVVARALVDPKPATPIPILLGGGRSRRAVDRIARKADGWLPSGMSPDQISAIWRRIGALADEYGRDRRQLELIPRASVVFTDRPAGPDRRPFQGSLGQILDDIAGAAEAGATELLLDLTPSAKDGDQLVDRALEMHDALATAAL
jgi:probable F420-dependent oxidoreductase